MRIFRDLLQKRLYAGLRENAQPVRRIYILSKVLRLIFKADQHKLMKALGNCYHT